MYMMIARIKRGSAHGFDERLSRVERRQLKRKEQAVIAK
jgi:hypothetical protein